MFHMIVNNDDFVAITYLFFGENSYETLSIALFSAIAKDCENILDIGAYTGLFSLTAAKSNPKAKIDAFEPLKSIAKRISDNAQINGIYNINVNSFAISNINGTSNLTIYGFSEAVTGSSLRQKPDNRILKTESVLVKKLDSLYNDNVQLIKIDVELDELNVLLGAEKLISFSRPIIILEVLNQEILQSIIDYLSKFEYELAYISETTIELIEIKPDNISNLMAKSGYGNIVCFPDKQTFIKYDQFSKNMRTEIKGS